MHASIFKGAIATLGLVALGNSALAATGNPKHFVEPSAVPSFGANNFVTTFDINDDITSFGSADVTGTSNLWTVGAPHTTKQEFTDFYSRRLNAVTTQTDTGGFVHDGSATLNAPSLTAHAPGYISNSGNFYSYAGDYGAHVQVSNYGGTTNARAGGTLLVLQTSAGLNPDFRPLYNVGSGVAYPDINAGQLNITRHDGSALPVAAEVLDFDVLYQADGVPSSFGPVPWQELIWTIWLADYTGDVKIDFGIPVHSAFSSLRADTAIGSIDAGRTLSSFQLGVVPEPASLAVLGLGAAGMLRRRR